MADDTDDVFVLEMYKNGEFEKVRVFAVFESAQKEAARLLYASVNDDSFILSALVNDVAEFVEWRDNINALFIGENYDAVLECWDDWVADANFDGPTPFNFDIVTTEVE